jgi:putative endonuclease
VTQQRLRLGKWGEELAVSYLRRRLYRIVATNYRSPVGEIDIIARRAGVLVFVEVKTRRGHRCGNPSEAVNQRKQRQIIRTAQWYLGRHGEARWQPRFDVIAIQAETAKPVIEHIIDAFGM